MQSKLTILAVLALLIVACEAPSGGGESPELAEKSAGKLSVGATPLRRDDQSPDRLYRRHCAECHGGVGGGDGPTTRILPAQPGDWTNPGTLGRMDDEQIRQKILYGTQVPAGRQQPMRGFEGKFSDSELAALIAYIRNFGSH